MKKLNFIQKVIGLFFPENVKEKRKQYKKIDESYFFRIKEYYFKIKWFYPTIIHCCARSLFSLTEIFKINQNLGLTSVIENTERKCKELVSVFSLTEVKPKF